MVNNLAVEVAGDRIEVGNQAEVGKLVALCTEEVPLQKQIIEW